MPDSNFDIPIFLVDILEQLKKLLQESLHEYQKKPIQEFTDEEEARWAVSWGVRPKD